MKEKLKRSILTPILIGLGAILLLYIGSLIGPFLFAFGLLGVCILDADLFTGKVGCWVYCLVCSCLFFLWLPTLNCQYDSDFMRYCCKQMGVKTVPVMWKGIIPAHTGDAAAIRLGQDAGAWIKEKAERFYDGPDPIGKTHIREGVVVRIVNRPNFTAFKHKNFDFKVLSNIAIEQAIETGAIEKMSDDEVSEL